MPVTYNWKDRKGNEARGTVESVEAFKAFIHEHKKEIIYIGAEINDSFWEFDRKKGWKEIEEDPTDTPF